VSVADALSPGALAFAGIAACWIMLPAWVPNPTAALFGGGRSIDGGRILGDGHRIFGDGKTWRGFGAGVLCGIGIGAVQLAAQSHPILALLPAHTPVSVIALSIGALLGDLIKSFFKRRLGKERGDPWPIVDQYDLVVGAFSVLLLADRDWMVANVTLPVLVAILVLTPLLHRGMNLIGYAAGIKDEPW